MTTAAIRLLLASADEATASGQHDLSRELMAAVEQLRAEPLLLDRYRALAKAADGMYAIGLRATDEWNGYAAARAAVREIEESTSSATAKTPPAR